MNVKDKFVKAIILQIEGLGYTYDEVRDKTGLTKSQISLILNHSGKGVSLDKIISSMEGLELEVYMEFTTPLDID